MAIDWTNYASPTDEDLPSLNEEQRRILRNTHLEKYRHYASIYASICYLESKIKWCHTNHIGCENLHEKLWNLKEQYGVLIQIPAWEYDRM